jgi:hypothetical protein
VSLVRHRSSPLRKRTFAAIFCLAAAAGCAATKPTDPIPAHGTISRTITWVLAEDPIQACNQALGKPLIGTRHACARLRGNECIIYVKPPRNEEDRTAIYILGHEALHCFVGNFHNAAN